MRGWETEDVLQGTSRITWNRKQAGFLSICALLIKGQ